MTILVTGAAGFIGFHVAKALLARGDEVLGLDNLNNYYDVGLKRARLAQLEAKGFEFHAIDVADKDPVFDLVGTRKIASIVHLAAQAGVRYSMVEPYAYVRSNVMGHVVMLETARRLRGLSHFVYASSSSVYGLNRELPFRESDRVDTPTSLYAATKRADELISHAYGHLYALPQTGLRFFTVYGPWGRPDMAYFSFAKAIMAGEPVTLYDGGNLRRDFTYIDDVVTGVLGVLDSPPEAGTPSRIINLGNNKSERVLTLVKLLEKELGRPAIIHSVPRPAADVEETWASIDRAAESANFVAATPLEIGIGRFAAWYKTTLAAAR